MAGAITVTRPRRRRVSNPINAPANPIPASAGVRRLGHDIERRPAVAGDEHHAGLGRRDNFTEHQRGVLSGYVVVAIDVVMQGTGRERRGQHRPFRGRSDIG